MAVWIVLYRESRGGTACISQRQIAERAGCGADSVNKAVKSLARMGLLKVVRKGTMLGKDQDGKVKGLSSKYRVRGLIPVE